jgi:tetratricopeptide (TPR) repeat protein
LALAEACRAGEADLALRITSGIWMFWRMEGAFREGRNWLHRSLHLAGAQASPHRSGALWGAGWLAYGQGDIGAAKQHADEMLARATGSDTTDRRNALTLLGQVAMAEADFAAAVPLLEEALVIARGTDERWHVATSLLNLGTALLHCDDAIRAQELLAEAVAGHQAVGDTDFVARSTVELGYAALVLGELASARSHFEGALQTFLQLHERWGLAEAVAGAAVLAAAHGDSDTAATLSGASEASYAEIAAQVIVPDAMLGAPFLAEARSAIGEQRWLQAKAAGRLLAIEVAAKAALDWTPPTSSS